MKFDKLYNKLMTENRTGAEGHEAKIDSISRLQKLGKTMSDADAAYVVIHDTLKGTEFAKEDDYIALGKELKDGGMSNDEYSLETLQKALEYAKYDGWSFDVSHIMELLGGNEDAEKHEYGDNDEFLDDYVHKGWPGDGSGEDDFADFNQMEGNDY
jgi:hypothetical protein